VGQFEDWSLKMKLKKVVVKWRDAKIYPGMHSEVEALKREMEIFESLGYLLKQDDRAMVIAHEVTNTGDLRDVLLIPSGSVIAVEELVTSSAV
jgi:hypothetical protein